MSDQLENRLVDQLDADAAAVVPSAPPSFSWQRPGAAPATRRALRRPLFTGAGLVAAATVVTLVATSGGGSGSGAAGHRAATADPTPAPSTTGHTPSPSNHASARSLLLAAATTRLNTGDAPLADGQYRYIRTTGPLPGTEITTASGGWTTDPQRAGSYTLDELWVPKDQTDVWERRQSEHDSGVDTTLNVWTGRCDDLYANTQDGPKGPACTRPGSFDDPTPAFIAGLPRNAGGLYRQLHAYATTRLNPDKDHDVDFVMFDAINDLLSGGVITGDLTSTLYAVLSRILGITVVDGARNADGVVGTGFRLSTVLGHGKQSARETMTVIVDLRSGDYLGYQDLLPGAPPYLDAVTEGVADRRGVAGH